MRGSGWVKVPGSGYGSLSAAAPLGSLLGSPGPRSFQTRVAQGDRFGCPSCHRGRITSPAWSDLCDMSTRHLGE